MTETYFISSFRYNKLRIACILWRILTLNMINNIHLLPNCNKKRLKKNNEDELLESENLV